jgi:hypothetical protein
MHQLATAIWHVLHDKTHYRELGADHFTRRDPERAMRRMLKEATVWARPSASNPSRPDRQSHPRVIFVSVPDGVVVRRPAGGK